MSADGETDSSQRCKEDPEVTKAVPDPVPDFFSPEEESEQSLDKYGANNHASLPVRKTKGGSEKKRDTSVEMMFTPMGKAMDPDEPEDIAQMKADLGVKSKQDILLPPRPPPPLTHTSTQPHRGKSIIVLDSFCYVCSGAWLAWSNPLLHVGHIRACT